MLDCMVRLGPVLVDTVAVLMCAPIGDYMKVSATILSTLGVLSFFMFSHFDGHVTVSLCLNLCFLDEYGC